MSYNKYNEFMLCRYNYPGGPYFISRWYEEQKERARPQRGAVDGQNR